MAHETSSYAICGAKPFQVFDYRQRNSSEIYGFDMPRGIKMMH